MLAILLKPKIENRNGNSILKSKIELQAEAIYYNLRKTI